MVARSFAVVLLVSLLFIQAQPLALAEQDAPPLSRLPYDGPTDLPHLPSAGVAAAPQPFALPPEPILWSKVTFQSLRNEKDWEVYTGKYNRTDQVNLTNHGASDVYPRLNRGATRVVYASNRDGNYEIYAMNADGSGQVRLTNHAANDIYPFWSPDSSRIVFQSYRDGQAELYVMNADGSGLQRLTNYGDYDGEPAWSPDGTQIAFTRRSSGQYRIWVMNADGSNPRQLSHQANSEHPVWSPDGLWIAYDADGSGNGWQEIWMMNATGGNQREMYTPSAFETDYWAGSWSPDGQYIAFTRISFIQYDGNWYWKEAYPDAFEVAATWRAPLRLSDSGLDWYPDWQTTDAQSPTSQVLALPTQSPATFTVRWTASDADGTGLSLVTVQVKDGADGAWTDWRSSKSDGSDDFTGVGGHTYYFRTQARDYAYNVELWPGDYDAVTRVEALPPQTTVQPLPRFSRSGVVVWWGSNDPGGSGIRYYDVQMRTGAGAWTDWRMGTTATSAIHTGASGETYSFRARSRDHAGNLEEWPATADATTTLYAWAIRGQATDNRGAPVAGMAVTTAPAALHTEPADRDGAYAAFVTGPAAAYTVSWSNPAYGALPATAYAPDRDAAANVVLPPVDNVVQDWGFEAGVSAWAFSGSLAGTITTAERHSGAAAASLSGSTASPLGSITTVSDPLRDNNPSIDAVMDAAGTIHSVWLALDDRVMYRRKPLAGSWSTPAPLPGPPARYGGSVKLAVGDTGTVHVVWTAGDAQYYCRSIAGAAWSTPEPIPGTSFNWTSPELAIGPADTVKLMFDGLAANGLYWDAHFTERRPGGDWTPSRNIANTYGPDTRFKVRIDPAGRAHVLWYGSSSSGHTQVYYAAENADGSWTPAEDLSQYETYISDADLVIDASGTAHVAWTGEAVYYRTRPAGGAWVPKQWLAPVERGGVSLFADAAGRIHLAWGNSAASQVYHTVRTGGAWSIPVSIAPATAEPTSAFPRLVVTEDGRAHVLWAQHRYYNHWTIRYTAQNAYGQFQPAIEVFHSDNESKLPIFLMDHARVPHAFWAAQVDGAYHALHAGPGATREGGEAILSQVVQVPDVPAPTLSFMYRFGSSFPSGSRLEVEVDDGSAATSVLSTNVHAGAWQHTWADLTPWAGQTVTIRFRLIQVAGGARASAHIDEVSVGSAHPDTWVGLSSQSAAPPGGTAVLTIGFGNRGGVGAENARVALQLPPELAFVSADPPPSTTAPELRWDAGSLAAQSAGAIYVTVRVEDTTARGTTVTSAVAIASDTVELEEGNNTAEGTTYIGYQTRLPIIHR